MVERSSGTWCKPRGNNLWLELLQAFCFDTGIFFSSLRRAEQQHEQHRFSYQKQKKGCAQQQKSGQLLVSDKSKAKSKQGDYCGKYCKADNQEQSSRQSVIHKSFDLCFFYMPRLLQDKMIKDRNVRPLCQLSSHFLKPPKVIEIQDGSTDGTKKKEPKESKTEEEDLMNTKDDNATRKQSQSLIAFCTSHHIQFLIPEKPCANTVHSGLEIHLDLIKSNFEFQKFKFFLCLNH